MAIEMPFSVHIGAKAFGNDRHEHPEQPVMEATLP